MRLIDADEVKTKAFGKRGGLIHTSDIDNAPTVDHVKHGRWIPLNDQIAKCSSCGTMESTYGKDKTGQALIHKAVKKYCPNCGAKMDGESNE